MPRVKVGHLGHLGHLTAPALVEVAADPMAATLEQAGPAGLEWHEGTPADWSDARLLAAGEVLYVSCRMVNRNGRRYLKAHAPPIPTAKLK